MSNVQDSVGAVAPWSSDDLMPPKHDITVYKGSGSSPEYVAMQLPYHGYGVGTSDGGQLVGWYDSGYLMRFTKAPSEAWQEGAEIARARREMAERLVEINAALQRIQEQLATVERAHVEQTSLARAPHLSALAWVKEATGFSDSRVAALLGVTRQALVRWRRGEPIAPSKRRHLLAVRDVLERATRLHPSVEELGAWLDTPQEGPDGRTPSDLLAQGDIDKARLLAVTHVSRALIPPPAWTREAGGSYTRDAHTQSSLPPWYDDDSDDVDNDTEPDVFVPLDLDGA